MPDSKRRKMGVPSKIHAKVEMQLMEDSERVEEIDTSVSTK